MGAMLWEGKAAYDAGEAATVLFPRKFGPAMRARAASPTVMLPMLTSALSCLAQGGRLVAITGASCAPDNLTWTDPFCPSAACMTTAWSALHCRRRIQTSCH
jgi:hypothetical protein